ncbi:MAG: AAA family ATPase [Bacteroidia bacterium]|jgi:MoxR-like ATPase|nr:AAA family ATPase [Bacteroidia bacterium]MDG2042788.1 AAA family ATPase [Bacteroidia bacterium]|tara:strand:+ start:18628 stop:19593 length:966 start_codon:yes stop_codon:yes gene_type:complete
MIDFNNDKKAADTLVLKVNELKEEIGKIIIGQDEVVNGLITSILSNGHALLIGVPGLAKTLLIKTISEALDLSFNRVQFTPDLMPSDIIGSEILDDAKNFKFNKGPVFANIVLADEINRTPPKTQAALLEAMQEKNVTLSGTKYPLGLPFFVLATQNPIEQEGTYPLPEAQLDRFMFNMILDYPSKKDEISIVKATTSEKSVTINPVLNQKEIIGFQDLVKRVPVSDHVYDYAVTLVAKTRAKRELATPFINDYLEYGAGPRASQYLIIGAKTNALIKGKYSPDIEDVQSVAKMVLRHRIVRNYKAESQGISADEIIESIF